MSICVMHFVSLLHLGVWNYVLCAAHYMLILFIFRMAQMSREPQFCDRCLAGPPSFEFEPWLF
jgi:hypothetical protein